MSDPANAMVVMLDTCEDCGGVVVRTTFDVAQLASRALTHATSLTQCETAAWAILRAVLQLQKYGFPVHTESEPSLSYVPSAEDVPATGPDGSPLH